LHPSPTIGMLFSLLYNVKLKNIIVYRKAGVYIVCSATQLNILHYTLYDTHCTLHTVHYTLYTTHCTLHTVHGTLYTTHCTLHTVHDTLYTTHYTLCTTHCALHTVHYTLYTTHGTHIWRNVHTPQQGHNL